MADLVVPAAIRALRAVVRKGLSVVKERLPQGTLEVEPALARNPQRLNPITRIRNQQAASKSYSQRAFDSSASPYARYYTTTSRATHQSSSPLKSAVGKHATISPFASTLRPKLCGALPRSAGGYTLGGGSARYFSHTPAAPADVIAQVSQAMRAFILSGKDIRYNQERQQNSYVKGQIRAQLAAASTDRLAPGAYVDFHMTPSLSCMMPEEPVGATCLDSVRGGFLDALNVDFQETIKDISAVFQDLRRLASLGALPVTLVTPHTLRVHFRGCDAEIVTRLCDEVGVMRGIIHEDERFAFDRILAEEGHANVNWQEMMSSEDGSDWSGSVYSHHDDMDEFIADVVNESAWQSEVEGDYDEIDPGGEASSSEGYGSGKLASLAQSPCDILAGCEGLSNPWVAVGKA